ncbi:LPD28 domain-containing protein [Oscillibacter ruminantium]|uniref:LPD28 domain-containing protein n=1 Tax=Oscillibacter ruminantium TaxID=1263547 RepID=UPI0033347FCD
MYPIDAATARFEAVEILSVPGLFTTSRVNRATVPKGMYAYDMQTAEDDWGSPCLLAQHITVEHYGTVLTASPIALPQRGYLDLHPGDFTQGGGAARLTVAEFEDRCFSRPVPRTQRQRHKARAANVPVR